MQEDIGVMEKISEGERSGDRETRKRKGKNTGQQRFGLSLPI